MGALVITAGGFDLKYRRVPNWLVLAGLLAGLLLNSVLYGLPGLWSGLQGMGLALLIYFPLYLLHAMGAGDAKLMAAVGSIVGPANWFGIFVVTGILGGLVGLIALMAKSRLRRGLNNVFLILTAAAHGRAPHEMSPELDVRRSEGLRMPHAAVITFGVAIFLWLTAIYAPR